MQLALALQCARSRRKKSGVSHPGGLGIPGLGVSNSNSSSGQTKNYKLSENHNTQYKINIQYFTLKTQ